MKMFNIYERERERERERSYFREVGPVSLQRLDIEIDINSIFANNEVWELNSHELGFSVPNKKGPRKSTF